MLGLIPVPLRTVSHVLLHAYITYTMEFFSVGLGRDLFLCIDFPEHHRPPSLHSVTEIDEMSTVQRHFLKTSECTLHALQTGKCPCLLLIVPLPSSVISWDISKSLLSHFPCIQN